MQGETKDMCTAIAQHIRDYYIVYRIILLRPETMLCYAYVVQYRTPPSQVQNSKTAEQQNIQNKRKDTSKCC